MKKPLIIAVLIFISYGLLLEFLPKSAQVKMQSQWQQNQYSVEKYLRNSIMGGSRHHVVIAGSSLANRLAFEDVTKCAYNLALSGDSALTGLSIIANSPPPSMVFVEINVPQRGINQNLINRASRLLPRLSSVFYIENMPINLMLSFLYQFKKDKTPKEPIEKVRQNALAMHHNNNQVLLPSNDLQVNMKEFSHLVEIIETKETKVVFFEMPVHPDLETTPRVVQIRNAFKNTFPKNQLIQFDELTMGSNIKTFDGIHLTEDEAMVVAKNMKPYFDDVCFDQN